MIKLRVKFTEPQSRYWDGGKRSGGEFTPDYPHSHQTEKMYSIHPGPGAFIKWGSWGLNFWFTARAGKSWRQAAVYARRKLCRLYRVAGAEISIEEG